MGLSERERWKYRDFANAPKRELPADACRFCGEADYRVVRALTQVLGAGGKRSGNTWVEHRVCVRCHPGIGGTA